MGFINRLLAPWRTATRFDEFLANQNALLREQLALARAQQDTLHQMAAGLNQLTALWMQGIDGECIARARDEEAEAWAEFEQRLRDEARRHDN